jgi:hypothetical protein
MLAWIIPIDSAGLEPPQADAAPVGELAAIPPPTDWAPPGGPGFWARCFVPSTQSWQYVFIVASVIVPAPPPKSGETKTAGVNQPLSDRPPAG